jgi:hypothetical protein
LVVPLRLPASTELDGYSERSDSGLEEEGCSIA